MMERLHNTGKAFLLAWLCMLCIAARANEPPKAATTTAALEKAISGKVTGDGEALPGASVVVKGTAIGATTDAEGSFKLSVPDDATTIVVSYIGYISQEIVIGSQTVFNITLIGDVATLGDIVVVGYGVQKKSDLTGAIASVKGDELAQLPTQRVDQALQGRAAGVMVLNQSGAPGGATTIRIRGSSSILGSNQPLIVIDGLQGGDLNSLNPNDVESMEVLKDASATAIYGSQGANGVILVTTKKGKKGHPVVNYSYNLGVQQLRKKLDVMNAGDFARSINDFKASQDQPGNVVITPTPVFTPEQIAGYDKNGFGTDWQNEVYRAAAMQNHQLSVSGGGENVQYLVSGGYLNQQGILINSAFKRFSLRANVNVDITKWASFGLSWAGIKETGNTPPFGEGSAIIDPLGQVVSVAPRWNATIPVYDENGNYSKHPSGYGEPNMWNPVASAKEAYTENNSIRNNINAFLDFKIAKGLTFRITGGAITRNQNNFRYLNNNTFAGFQKNGYGTVDDAMYTRYQNSNILTYDRTVGRHHFVITGVAEQQVEQNKGMSILANDFLVDQAGIYDLGGASSVVPASFNTKRVINSFLGRVNYSFADKYLLTASYRADGSSVFGANNKWGYFPSASVAWRISEEGFMQDVDAVSDLKLRASWGITGNQAISPYASLSQLQATADTRYPYNGGSVTDIGMDIVRAANPNLKWESTTQTDIGLDLGLFNGRLNLTADYYVKTTEDLLLSRQLPTYTGFPNIIDNVGSTRNKGIELSIGGDPLVGPLRWNTSFNISGNRSKVLKLTDANKLPFRTTPGAGYGISTNANTALLYLQEGQPFGQMTGWITEGTWSEGDRDKAAAFGQLPGDIKYKDVNGDGLINNKDLTVIGNAFPKFIFGWNNRFSFKNFDLSFLIQGVQGNDLFNLGRVRLERPGEGTSTALLSRWTPDNQDTSVPAFTKQSERKAAGLTNKVTVGDNRVSRWVEDASYIRLKNITFAYNFPQALTRKVGMNRLRLYVSGQNLFTITKYTGYDPEVSSFNTNDANIGVDFASYPTSKVYTMGIDLTF